ncbi:hypothetical protein ARMSODRAFT_980764 [Armillaria solidipes]|uniref:CCHC-type domain-containing protein n=1 Tax=Armillaria solidipes TaxID=1076256 RepID=A0A2H3BGW5_9AGAR|nr:hypothetical protein ARMSODRAFT_980764 [Armillaria solidipes]
MGIQECSLSLLQLTPIPLPPARLPSKTMRGDASNEAGGSGGPPQPSAEERQRQAEELAELKLQRLKELKESLEDEQRAYDAHIDYWKLPNKGKAPENQPPNPPVPNARRPLEEREDQWSIPRPPPGRGRPNPVPNPVGIAPDDAAYLGVKPTMIKTPAPYTGAHDDIERFVGDCLAYFEVFASYFTLPSLMVTFAASHLEGPAKDWWVYARADFWAPDQWGNENARFRLPNFEEFVGLLTAQFRDPAIEEVHEKKMYELRMGNGAATTYFQEIIAMHEERQRKWAFDKVQRTSGRDSQPPQKSITAPSQHKAGGATSSTTAKPSGNAPSRDAGTGRWHSVQTTMYKGAGEPMDIGQMRAKGLCFRCRKHGHLSKDCPDKKQYKDVRSMVLSAEEPPSTTKIEEVKETVV